MNRFAAPAACHLIVAVSLSAFSAPGLASEGVLHVGWAEVVITPPREVALVGQMHPRIAGRARDPLTATVLALETKQDGRSLEQAVMISCDLGYIRQVTEEGVRRSVSKALEDLDPEKVFLHATHTHTAPGQVDGTFRVWWGDEPAAGGHEFNRERVQGTVTNREPEFKLHGPDVGDRETSSGVFLKVSGVGIKPTRPEAHRILESSRVPIPPPGDTLPEQKRTISRGL